MRRWMAIWAVWAAASLPAAAYAADTDAARFDGTWAVVLFCPQSVNAFAYTFEFDVQVKGGVLHGENGVAGQPSWLALDGPIRPDGTATLQAKGLSGDPAFSGGSKPATAYTYEVNAQFKGSNGTGSRTSGRVCNLSFLKR